MAPLTSQPGIPCVHLPSLVQHADKIHFFSQTFGLITGSLLVVQFLLGAGSVWFSGVAFGGGQKAKLVWKYHRFSGYLTLLSLVTTIHFGGWSTWVSAHSMYPARVVAYTLAPLGILLSVYSRIRCPIHVLTHPQYFSNQSLLGHQR